MLTEEEFEDESYTHAECKALLAIVKEIKGDYTKESWNEMVTGVEKEDTKDERH